MLIEMLNTRTQVDRVTEKYVYSLEIQEWRRVEWFVGMKSYMTPWGFFKRGGHDCRVFHTEAEAVEGIRDVARTWNHDEAQCYVFSREDVATVIKKHRNKVRG